MTPLANPGMPWIEVTLLWTKYSSQVALKNWLELQKKPHNFDGTVMLFISLVLEQMSMCLDERVRLPSMQTLSKNKQGERWSKGKIFFKKGDGLDNKLVNNKSVSKGKKSLISQSFYCLGWERNKYLLTSSVNGDLHFLPL